MKQICIYNFETKFDNQIIKDITSTVKSNDEYFLSRNWEGGPHIQLIFSNKYTEEEIECVASKLREYMKSKTMPKEQEALIKNKYEKYFANLALLENKKEIRSVKDHGLVEIRPYDFFYQNQNMTTMYIKKRFEIQSLLLETFELINSENLNPIHIFSSIFSRISNIYNEDGKNKGYFSFISHVHGFFELSKKENRNISEEIFEDIFKENIEIIQDTQVHHFKTIEKWSNTFEIIYKDLYEDVNNLVDSSYQKSIEDSINALNEQFNNDFHKNFVKYSQDKNFTENKKATAYRLLINLLYLTLPLFKISAYKKQQCIYFAYRLVEESRGITWREEIGLDLNNK